MELGWSGVELELEWSWSGVGVGLKWRDPRFFAKSIELKSRKGPPNPMEWPFLVLISADLADRSARISADQRG